MAMSAFSDYLRKRMAEQDLNQAALAALVKMSPSVVGDWLNKDIIPRWETLLQVAEALGEDETELLLIAYELRPPEGRQPENEQVERIMRKVAKMPEDVQAQLEAYIDFLLARGRVRRAEPNKEKTQAAHHK